MVKLHAPQLTITNGVQMPVMNRHNLRVVKSAPNFKEAETVECFICRYANGRFAVWDSTWMNTNKYHVFQSEAELHEHFEEL